MSAGQDEVVAEELPVIRAGRMRRSVATRVSGPAGRMIRFVVSPEGLLVPDLAARLPGRGFWIESERSALERAIVRGQFAKAARMRVAASAALVEQVGDMLARRCLDLVGLARRAGGLVAGFDQVAAWLRHNRAALILAASDGSTDGRQRIAALAGDAPVLAPFDRYELGAALGRDEVVHLAFAESGLAGQLLQELERLRGFREFSMPERHAAGSNVVAEGASRT